jgi:hypothetical protein
LTGRRGWVLVTDGGTGGSRDALAATRALHRAGYRVALTVSGRSWPAPSRYAARRVPVPPVASGRFAEAIRNELERAGYPAVVPASEAALAALGVGAPHLLDKLSFAAAARAAGLEVPPERSFDSTESLLAAQDELDYPVVVKPRTRRYLAFRAQGPSDLRRAPEDGGPAIVQPFVEDGLHAVSGVVAGGRLVAVVHERWLRIWPYPCGLACAAETTAGELDVEERLVALLHGYDGIFCAQFVGPYVFDVNLRIHSSHPLAVAAGANLIAIACDVARGDPVPLRRGAPGFFYRWLEGDVRHAAQAVSAGRMSLVQAARALAPRRGAAHSTESLRDPGPMLSRLWYAARRVKLSADERRSSVTQPS